MPSLFAASRVERRFILESVSEIAGRLSRFFVGLMQETHKVKRAAYFIKPRSTSLSAGLRQSGFNSLLCFPGIYSSSRLAGTRKHAGLLSTVPRGTGAIRWAHPLFEVQYSLCYPTPRKNAKDGGHAAWILNIATLVRFPTSILVIVWTLLKASCLPKRIEHWT
jgi:hypothetical protein